MIHTLDEMPQEAPLVTIGMPVYNGARTLGHALDSVLAQSLDDFEIVISDNGSTDETAEIIAQYAARDQRVRPYRSTVNLGARTNYNRVLELARGRFFKWAAHDDWITPDYLESCVGELEANPTAVLCYSAMCRVDAQGDTRRLVIAAEALARSTSARRRIHDALWHVPYHPIFGLFRTSALRLAGGIPNCPEPDRVTLTRIASQGPFIQISDVLFFQRSPEKNTPNRNVWQWLDPSNVSRRPLRILRVSREIFYVINSAGLPSYERLWLLGDACVAIAAKTVRGKLRQVQRRYRLGYGRGPKIHDSFVLDWEKRSADEAVAKSQGRRESGGKVHR